MGESIQSTMGLRGPDTPGRFSASFFFFKTEITFVTSSCFSAPLISLEKGLILKGKNLFPCGANSFL